MGMRELEQAILAELRQVAKNDKIKLKDISEWRTGTKLVAQQGETLFYLPVLGVSCAVILPSDKNVQKPPKSTKGKS